MGDVSNLLLELKQNLEDANDFLACACNTAIELTGDDPDQDDGGWPLMGEVIDSVAALQTLLLALKNRPDLAEQFQQARADLDHLSDQADAASC